MEGGCGTRRHFPCLTEHKLIATLCRVCPQEGPMIASFISEQERVFRVVGVLCMLYRFQDREIHKLARISDPSLSISFGDREWNWIMCGGPAQFFARVEPTFREHYPDMYDPDILQAAWEYFQILTTGVHIAYMAQLIGHVPSCEEYVNPGLIAWYYRLAKRFEPIRPVPTMQ
jgi:hypothetical protein